MPNTTIYLTSPVTGTFLPPNSCPLNTVVLAAAWGAGSGGSGRNGTTGGGGGSGGGYTNTLITISSTNVSSGIAYTIGEGSNGAPSSSQSARGGNTTFYNSDVLFSVGGGGTGGAAGGNAATANFNPMSNFRRGGNGALRSQGGGAGGAGGPAGNGNSSTTTAGGSGGAGSGGAGGAGSTGAGKAGGRSLTNGGGGGGATSTNNLAGGPGGFPGGGGGGETASTSGGSGGNGANGMIMLTWSQGPIRDIFVGLTAWANNTSYSVGDRRKNNGCAYECTVAGTSAPSGTTQGPFGTNSSITDGTVTWKYLSVIDAESIQEWVDGWPSTFTQNITGQIWNTNTITTTAGTSYMSATGHNTNGFFAILTCPMNASKCIRETLSTNSSAEFIFDSNDGVSFTLPSSAGVVNYFNIDDKNIVFDGLQFKDPLSTSTSTIINYNDLASGGIIRNCIIDGFGQTGGAVMIGSLANVTIINCLIIDRQGATDVGECVRFFSNTGNLLNSIIYSSNNNTTGRALISDSGVVRSNVINSGFFNFQTPTDAADPARNTIANSIFSSANMGFRFTDAGNNLLSKTAANQFTAPGTNFRLLSTSDMINVGQNLIAYYSPADDFKRTIRNADNWDIGPWEFISQQSNPFEPTIDPLYLFQLVL